MTDRSKLAKCIGMLGSAHEGERVNALTAANRELADANMSWLDIACLAERIDVHDRARTTLFDQLLLDRLHDGLVHAWAMGDGEATFVRGIKRTVHESGSLSATVADMQRAIKIADEARRRGGTLARARSA